MHQRPIDSIFCVTKCTAIKQNAISPYSKKLLLQQDFANEIVTKLELQNGKISYGKLEDDDAYQIAIKSEHPPTTALRDAILTNLKSENKTIDICKAEQRASLQLLTPPDTPITKVDPTKSDTAATVKVEVAAVASGLTKATKQAPTLLTLPANVRNKVYGYVLGGKEYHVHIPDETPICTPTEPTECQLLLVCKQIYTEANLLPVSLNVFYVYPHSIHRWLYAETFTPKQEDSISQLRFNWPEANRACLHLELFWGLKAVHVTYVPDGVSMVKFGELVKSMRRKAGKMDLAVEFWSYGIGSGRRALFT